MISSMTFAAVIGLRLHGIEIARKFNYSFPQSNCVPCCLERFKRRTGLTAPFTSCRFVPLAGCTGLGFCRSFLLWRSLAYRQSLGGNCCSVLCMAVELLSGLPLFSWPFSSWLE